MKTKLLAFAVFVFAAFSASSQEPVDVTDQKIKVGAFKEEELYFGFAEGDKIIFNFQEIDKKELKEIEIIEYPTNSKFSDFKTSRVENKMLYANKRAVYVFRFKNSAMTGRICHIQIQRIPANESTKSFNPTVTWVNQQDTTWSTYTKEVVVGYDTTYEQKTKKELVKSERTEELLLDKSQRVHSTSNENGNRTSVFVTLPQNQLWGNTTKKVISWAYWVGVGEEANQAWKNNAKTISSLTKGAATYFTTPLGALAVGAVTDLMIPSIGEDVSYAVTDQANRNFFLRGLQYRFWDGGKGVAGYRKFSDNALSQGSFYICLANDNMIQGIDANIKVVAIVETNTYEDKAYTETIVKPRYEKQLFKEPSLSNKNVPVAGL